MHASNTPTAFQNNSQNKFVRTADGWLHTVYESNGSVWLEHSSDGGTSWQLNVDGTTGAPGPLDFGGGKCPSMTFIGNTVAVVFQQKDGNNFKICLSTFVPNSTGSRYQTYTNGAWIYPQHGETSDAYSTDANPTIAWAASDALFVVTFERKGSSPGLYYFYGGLWTSGGGLFQAVSTPVAISGTNANSTYASISTNGWPNTSGVITYDVAWEQYSSPYRSDIWYAELVEVHNPNPWIFLNPGTNCNISSASYYACSVRPSVVSLSDQSARVSWVGDKDGNGTYYNVQAVTTNPLSPSVYTAMGAAVKSVSTGPLDNHSDFCMAYSQNYPGSTWINNVCRWYGPSGLKTLNTAGKDIQLSNGPSTSSMWLTSFYPFSSPYPIRNSQSLASAGLSKATPTPMAQTRGVVIACRDLKYAYSFGNLVVDGKSIEFIPAPDSLRYSDLGVVNSVLETLPFSITGASNITFTESSGFVDSSVAAQTLGIGGYVGSTMQLLDAATNQPLGTIKNSSSRTSGGAWAVAAPYSLTPKGIGARQVKIKGDAEHQFAGNKNRLHKELFTCRSGKRSGKGIIRSTDHSSGWPSRQNMLSFRTTQTPSILQRRSASVYRRRQMCR